LPETILITGVAGFIGSNIAKKFLNENYNVIGIDDLSTGNLKNIPEEVDFIKGDICDKKIFDKVNKYCSYILHLAGQSSGEISFEDPIDDLQKNTISTLNVIKFGIEHRIKKLIYASSMSIYGDKINGMANEDDNLNPISCYGVSKLASEHYLKIFSKDLPYISLRMFNVYGPGQDLNNLKQGMVSIFISQALKNNKIVVKGSLDRFRDFIYINDVVDVWYKLTINNKISNVAINVGTGEKTTVKSLLEKINSKFINSNYFSEGDTPGDQKGIFANNKKLKNLCNLNKFITLDDGLDKYLNSIVNKN